MKPEKIRLDQLLVDRKLAKSRSASQRLIQAGEVFVDGERRDKPASSFLPSVKITVKQRPKHVSQGGLKLERAISSFQPDIEGKVCVDIGASTGGFTDCLLQHGAEKVYAIDVGKGQLDWKLRNDSRVIVMEGVNARYLQYDQIGELADLITVDVSFISLKLILPPIKEILSPDGRIILLVKPQFEAGRSQIERGGVVKNPETHMDVLNKVYDFAIKVLGLSLLGVDWSPFKGPAGNIEFLLYLSVNEVDAIPEPDWHELVREAHSDLESV